ncbi:Flagellum-specific peptidoglycan hydrolase FlgJ [Tessaracoccus bendigoensis DSM 12906]|uniref:Flagellum-specific peptidoglycan hydrolase FlgJ n=1 Tax=Tessaracoccus bendigoensis DSM 12906 TaxID=1123357 RepID=A0A1M6DS13_9ACTN|nr:peptidoglycan-binding protein [Tessaracoccus bendigoensis]SHI76001.1 Flagellum-specific peptidoglycan hydrolase FlgJ [Tessaracoccus bendigoensis DSM 12906]
MRWIKVAVAAALVLGIAAIVPNQATASVQSEFIEKLVKPAQENERKTGIPSSVAIGMAALETGWGRSKMAGDYTVDKGLPTETVYKVNTLFNIKCTSTKSPYQTGCVPVRTAEYKPDGAQYFIVDEFRTYASWGDSILDYGRLLTSASRYAKAFEYKAHPDQFVTEVRSGGYATDPSYATQVISIMRSYDLYRYNLSGAGSGFPSGMGDGGTSGGSDAGTGFAVGGDFPAYQSGSSGQGVKTLQLLLNAADAAGLEADGSYGKLTAAAVSSFQKKQGITSTGTMDDQTWEKLLPSLKAGSSGPAVTALQGELNEAGHDVDVVGSFGEATTKAVGAFQKANRIKETGRVDSLTWARLIG